MSNSKHASRTRIDFGEAISAALRLLLRRWHCVGTVRRELTSAPIMHLSKTRVDGRELTSAPLGLLRRLWQCMGMDRREFTSTPIMHL